MEEILFRARRNDNGEWIYGTPYQEYSSFWCEWEWKIQTKHPLTNVPYMHLTVDRKTISQFTGLADKNYKKIFKGDIVKYRDDSVGVVDFADGAFGVRFNDGTSAMFLCFAADYSEVIGNIYDNPELL